MRTECLFLVLSASSLLVLSTNIQPATFATELEAMTSIGFNIGELEEVVEEKTIQSMNNFENLNQITPISPQLHRSETKPLQSVLVMQIPQLTN